MSYIQASDIADAYGQALLNKVSAPEGSTTSSATIIQRGIDSASSLIDAYIGGRYTLPLSVVPPVVVELAIDIALYKMAIATTRRTPEMTKRYDDAMSILKDMAAGKVSIGLSDADLASNGDIDVTKQTLGRSIRTYRG